MNNFLETKQHKNKFIRWKKLSTLHCTQKEYEISLNTHCHSLVAITLWGITKWTLQITYMNKDVCTFELFSGWSMLGGSRNHIITSKYIFFISSSLKVPPLFSLSLFISPARPCKSFKNISNIQSTTKGTRKGGKGI